MPPYWRKYLKRGFGVFGIGGVFGVAAYSLHHVFELRKIAERNYVVVKAEEREEEDSSSSTSALASSSSSSTSSLASSSSSNPERLEKFPSRLAQLERLADEEFDILVIGGGATGTGVALDAQTRGLKTALVEKCDFSSGTSSRSTKLIHGGVRYLQKAILGFDKEQYNMVSEALQERANLVNIAPHLAYALPIMLPVYTWWQVPYFWVGIKAYDIVAGRQLLKSSYFIGKEKSLEIFPMLKKESLKGAIVYYDGQHNDARMCISVGLTAARYGAAVANHVEVLSLIKSKDKQSGNASISGAVCRDVFTGKQFNVKAKAVVNATGPFTDAIREMDNPDVKPICQPSAGVHIVLPDYYCPDQMGLLDPNTSDGRVIFFLPWMKYTIAGTTDTPCPVTRDPQPTEQDVEFILGEIKNYLNADITVRRGDVTSCWSGIRPLVSDPNKGDTQSLARNHIIHVSDDGLITIAGGKWTTYRSMAEETVDATLQAHPRLKPSISPKSRTLGLTLEGGEKWTPTMHIRLVQDFGLETAVAQHLVGTYGDKAVNVARLTGLTGKRSPVHGIRLHEEFPYLEGEVRYACKAEYAQTCVDILAHRTRLSFLNANAAKEAVPRILDIMQEELLWSEERRKSEESSAERFLVVQMGIELRRKVDRVLHYSAEEIEDLTEKFRVIDEDSKGFISAKDLRRVLKSAGYRLSEEEMHNLLDEVDINRNGQIELDEFLQFLSAVKAGRVAGRVADRITDRAFVAAAGIDYDSHKFGPERSGGGV